MDKAITFHGIEEARPERKPKLSEEELRRVEEKTRYERRGQMVTVLKGRRLVTPRHVRLQ